MIGPSASAAAVSKLVGLTAEEIEDAFGIAYTQGKVLTFTRISLTLRSIDEHLSLVK